MNVRQCLELSKTISKMLLICCCIIMAAACTFAPAAPTVVATPAALEPTVVPTLPTPTPAVIVVAATATPESASESPVDSTIGEATTAVLTATDAAGTTDSVSVQAAAPTTVTTVITPTVITPTDAMTATTALTATQQTTRVAQPAIPEEDQPVVALVVGVNAAFDPFEYMNEQGQLVGFDIDLMNALAQAATIEVSFVDMDFNELIPAVVNGDLDVAISAITRTEERAALVAFTEPYFTTDQSPVSFFSGGQGLAVRTDTTMIQTAADLTADIRVGVKSGTTGDFFVVENTDAQIIRFDEAPTALAALANGDVEAVVTDIAFIAEFVTDHPALNVQLMGKPLTVEAYAIAVNQERIDLLQILNAALVKIKEDGTYDQLFEKWFQLP